MVHAEGFNYILRDDASLGYYDLGSNCSTSHTTFKCNAADNALLHCRDEGDTAVCLESAYGLTTTWPDVPGGLQTVASPAVGLYAQSDEHRPVPDQAARDRAIASKLFAAPMPGGLVSLGHSRDTATAAGLSMPVPCWPTLTADESAYNSSQQSIGPTT